MHYKLTLAIVVPAILCAVDASTAQGLNHPAIIERGTPTTRDALATVEANRPKLIERMVDQYRAPLKAHAITIDAFRAALWDLAPDRLLAASLADSIEEVHTIIAQAVATPTRADAKDGPGTGANSWIGYTAGNNKASGTGSAVAAGTNNVAAGQNSFVGAGTFNLANAQGAFVGAGTSNVANAISALVMGGFDNQATVIDSAVVAGAGNRATGARSVVVGGGYNLASGQWSFIGGGGRQTTSSGGAGTSAEDHIAAGDFSTVGGGQGNRAGGSYSTVGGGGQNNASVNGATVAGGHSNSASNSNSTVGGGENNQASGFGATVAGGGLLVGACGGSCGNTASNDFATVGGGVGNIASGHDSTVAGGGGNTASGDVSTVAGGEFGTASGFGSAVGGGVNNTASGTHSAIPGGLGNVASGAGSVAMGRTAFTQTSGGLVAIHDGAFVFSDGSKGNFHSTASNSFNVLATGGVRIVTGATNTAGEATPTWTCSVSNGSSWACSSDRNLKQNLVRLNGREILHKLASVPIFQWNPKGVNSHVTHFGPTAQDFHAAFGLGDSELMIGQQDADGVALAAIQGLNQRLDEKDAKIDRLERELVMIKRTLGLE